MFRKVLSGEFGDPEVFDSGYYFRGRVLVTWLRSKFNRGVNVFDIDPSFVPEVFVFCGTFASPVGRIRVFRDEELPDERPAEVMFRFDFVEGVYFLKYRKDVVYETEVLCWVEQFVGRALRVSRYFGVPVSVLVPNCLSYSSSVYLYSILVLPDEESVGKVLRRLVSDIRRFEERLSRCSVFLDSVRFILRGLKC